MSFCFTSRTGIENRGSEFLVRRYDEFRTGADPWREDKKKKPRMRFFLFVSLLNYSPRVSEIFAWLNPMITSSPMIVTGTPICPDFSTM